MKDLPLGGSTTCRRESLEPRLHIDTTDDSEYPRVNLDCTGTTEDPEYPKVNTRLHIDTTEDPEYPKVNTRLHRHYIRPCVS